MRRFTLVLIAVLVLGSSSCSTFSHLSDPGLDDLERSVSSFTKYFRWKQFAKAKLFVLPDRERLFVRFAQTIESTLDINEFSVDDLSIDESDTAAGLRTEGRAQVQLSYTRLPSNVFHNKTIEQVWVVHGGQWMLEFPEDGWKL